MKIPKNVGIEQIVNRECMTAKNEDVRAVVKSGNGVGNEEDE